MGVYPQAASHAHAPDRQVRKPSRRGGNASSNAMSYEYYAMPTVKYPPPAPHVRSQSKPSAWVKRKTLQPFQGYVPRVEEAQNAGGWPFSSERLLADAEKGKQVEMDATSPVLCAGGAERPKEERRRTYVMKPASAMIATAAPAIDTHFSLQGLPPQPPPSPRPAQLESFVAAAGSGSAADEQSKLSSTGAAIELEALEAPPVEGRVLVSECRQDKMMPLQPRRHEEPDSPISLIPPSSQHVTGAVLSSASSNPGLGPAILYGELITAPYTPTGHPPHAPSFSAASTSHACSPLGGCGWESGAPSSQRMPAASMGTMTARQTSRGGLEQRTTRGCSSSISIVGRRPVSAHTAVPPISPSSRSR